MHSSERVWMVLPVCNGWMVVPLNNQGKRMDYASQFDVHVATTMDELKALIERLFTAPATEPPNDS